MDLVPPRPSRVRRLRGPAMLLGGGFIVAASVTLMFLGMRSVLDVGGFCASGGPYEIAVECPDVAGPALTIGIFGWFAGAGLLAVGSGAVGGAWAITPLLAWSGLFGALGWNFLEYAFAGGGIDPGWLVCGVVFEAMAIVPLVVVGLGAASSRRAGTRAGDGAARRARTLTGLRTAAPVTGPGRPPAAEPPAGRTYEPAIVDGDVFALPDVRTIPSGDGGTGGTPDRADEIPDRTGGADVVSALERLAALHAAGQLTEREYALAKEAVLAAASEDRP